MADQSDNITRILVPADLRERQLAPLLEQIEELRRQMAMKKAVLESMILGAAYASSGEHEMDNVDRVTITADCREILLHEKQAEQK